MGIVSDNQIYGWLGSKEGSKSEYVQIREIKKYESKAKVKKMYSTGSAAILLF